MDDDDPVKLYVVVAVTAHGVIYGPSVHTTFEGAQRRRDEWVKRLQDYRMSWKNVVIQETTVEP